MRRTEMLSKLTDLIHEFRRNTVGVSSTELAEKVLTEIEVAGMMPPDLPSDYCQAIMNVYIDYNLNMWEEQIEKDAAVMSKYESIQRRKRVK